MTKEETKMKIIERWQHWSAQREFSDIEGAMYCFFEELISNNDPIISEGKFGYGDPWQHIHSWLLEHRRNVIPSLTPVK